MNSVLSGCSWSIENVRIVSETIFESSRLFSHFSVRPSPSAQPAGECARPSVGALLVHAHARVCCLLCAPSRVSLAALVDRGAGSSFSCSADRPALPPAHPPPPTSTAHIRPLGTFVFFSFLPLPLPPLSMSFRSAPAKDRQLKKTIDGNDARHKRQEVTVQLRAQKREESVQKRRHMTEGAAAGALEGQTAAQAQAAAEAKAQELMAKLQQLPQLCAMVMSDQEAAQVEAVTNFRKLLSIERNPPIQQVIDSPGVVARLVQFLTAAHNPVLQVCTSHNKTISMQQKRKNRRTNRRNKGDLWLLDCSC